MRTAHFVVLKLAKILPIITLAIIVASKAYWALVVPFKNILLPELE